MAKITVIMPVYNGETYLEEAIDSILNQTYSDFKLLVLNDNSSDSTPQILENFKTKDPRVEVINKSQNVGPANLRNEGIEKAQTEFIALMDADDIALPTRFEKQLEVFNKDPEIGVCGSWFTVFGDKKEKVLRHAIEHENLKVQFLSSCGIGNPTVMFKKSVLGNERFEHQYVPAEDYGLWSQLLTKTKFYNIPESLLRYRWHPGNISQTKQENLRKSEVLIKKRQLQHLGIKEDDKRMDAYLNAVSLKRQQSPEQLKKTIEASKDLLKRNQEFQVYDTAIFEKHITTIIVRSIRNANQYNMAFYKYLKKESGHFKNIPFIDKLVLLSKSLF